MNQIYTPNLIGFSNPTVAGTPGDPLQDALDIIDGNAYSEIVDMSISGSLYQERTTPPSSPTDAEVDDPVGYYVGQNSQTDFNVNSSDAERPTLKTDGTRTYVESDGGSEMIMRSVDALWGSGAPNIRIYIGLELKSGNLVLLTDGATTGNFAFVRENGGTAAPESLAGSPDYYWDGSLIDPQLDRDDIYQGTAEDTPNVVEIRDLDTSSTGWDGSLGLLMFTLSAWRPVIRIGMVIITTETIAATGSNHDTFMALLADRGYTVS